MKVKELIAELQKYDGEMEVFYDLLGDGAFEDSVQIKEINTKEGKIMLGTDVEVLKSIVI